MNQVKKFYQYERGIAMMTLSSICVSIFGLFAKLSMISYSLNVMMALRFAGPFFICLPYFWYAKTFSHLRHRVAFSKHFFRAMVVIVSQYSLFYYLTKATLINAVMLWNTSPIFIPIIARVLFKDRIGTIGWLSILLGLIGIVCILQPEVKTLDLFSFWGLLSGFSMALSQVLYGHNRGSTRTDVNIFYLFLFTSLVSLLTLFIFNVLIKRDFMVAIEPILVNGYRPYLYVLIIALGSIGNQFLKGGAYFFATPSFLSPFIYLAVLFSGILDWLVFRQIPNFLFILGSILVVFSVLLRFFFPHKR